MRKKVLLFLKYSFLRTQTCEEKKKLKQRNRTLYEIPLIDLLKGSQCYDN